jgi:DNA end-binding protein Ku
MHGREQLVLIRPMENLLAMSVLDHEDQRTKPQTFEDQAPDVKAAGEEVDMTRTLIKAKTNKKFDVANYPDVYTQKLTAVIEAKVAGKEVVAPPPVQEQPHIINLTDALRASVASVTGEETTEETPEKKLAPSKGKERRARKKKSS